MAGCANRCETSLAGLGTHTEDITVDGEVIPVPRFTTRDDTVADKL